ncbi:MAG: hypothetical protein SCK28_14535 [Bacillota bacterium]|nr:hypothetical protein [Bacillota bacterium]
MPVISLAKYREVKESKIRTELVDKLIDAHYSAIEALDKDNLEGYFGIMADLVCPLTNEYAREIKKAHLQVD